MLPEKVMLLITGDDYLYRNDNKILNVTRASCLRFVVSFLELLDWPTKSSD